MSWKEYLRLLGPLWHYPWDTFFVILSVCIYGFANIYSLVWLKNLTDAIQNGDSGLFFVGFWFFAGLSLLPYVLVFVEIPIRNRLQKKIQNMLYESYFLKYVNADQQLLERYGTGKVNSIFQRGIDNRSWILRGICGMFVRIVVGFILCFVFIFSSFPLWIFLISLFLIFGFFGFSRIFVYWLKPVRKRKRELITLLDSYVVRLIMSKFEILVSNKKFFEITKLHHLFSKYIVVGDQETFLQLKSFQSLKISVDLVRVVFLFYGGLMVLEGTMSIGSFFLFHLLTQNLKSVLMDLGDYIEQFSSQIVTVEKLRDTFDHLVVLPGLSQGCEFQYQKGNIVLKNVSFGYTDTHDDEIQQSTASKKVFKTLDLEIQGGQRIGLVGPSGGGKSTLIKLIAGYLFPEKGSILIDGQALPHGRTVRTSKTVSLESYYQHIGYLTQEPMVFDGTIRDNILYALPENDVDISHERIHEVLKLACCDFVFDLPKGIDTQIGEKGVRLSGGQRQRLAIAKIMLKDPQIVLLDEPTSALDSLNEQLITTALHNLFVGRTVIVIAHRLQTVKECDEILVIDEGKILQRGRHDELVKQGGYYQKMLELQSAF